MFEVGKTYTYTESDGDGGTFTGVFRVDHLQRVDGREDDVAVGVSDPGNQEYFDYFYGYSFEEYGWVEVES